MDKQKLLYLLQKSESTKLDYKLQLSLKTESEKKELAKDVTAIANSKGGRGYIIFGIEDKTLRIAGIDEKKYREEQIQQIISQRCEPPVAVNFNVIYIDDKALGVLTIYKSNQKPHQIRQNGTFYIRRGSTTDFARREEIASMFQETGLLQYESIVVNNAAISDLDEKLITEYVTKIGINDNTVDYLDILERVGAVGRDEDSSKFHPTVGGLLVFGKNPQQFLPNTGIKIVNNYNKELNKYFTGPIIKMLDEIEEYIRAVVRNHEYPIEAVIEAVANAVVHRDYFVYGKEITIILSEDKIEISNPGSICSEDDDILYFEEYAANRRNPWLYQRLLILDNKSRFLKSGLGIVKMKQAFKHIGDVKLVNSSKRNLFKVILPGLKYAL